MGGKTMFRDHYQRTAPPYSIQSETYTTGSSVRCSGRPGFGWGDGTEIYRDEAVAVKPFSLGGILRGLD